MNKLVLITGASQGIGNTLATNFAKEGYDVIITYNKSKSKSKELSQKLTNDFNIKCTSYHLDITKENNIKKLYKKIKKQKRNIDILINNAALDIYNEIEHKNKKDYKKILDTNLIGPFLMIKYYEKNNKGYIFNIASTDGIDTYQKNRLEYCTSKAGLINLTKCLKDNSNYKIYSISPNWVETKSVLEMNPNELKEELKRINQKRLIKKIEIYDEINNILKNNIPSGENIIIKGE